MAGKRVLGLVVGGVLLILGAALLGMYRHAHLITAYGMRWFTRLGPGEGGFLALYFVLGTGAVISLAYGLSPWVERLRGVFRWGREHFALLRLLLAAAAAVAVAVVAIVVLRDQVVTDDEYVYLFQGRILLTGHATAPAPALPEFFTNVFVAVRDGRWFGQYPPGHPLLLLPGIALGWPRLVPILLAGLNLALTLTILKEIAGRAWAVAGGLLLLVSPLFLLTGATLLSHPTCYFGLALGTWGVLRARREDTVRWGLAAGAGLGLAFLTRPYTGLVVGAFPAGALLWLGVSQGRRRALAAAVALVFVAAGGFLLYNRAASGSLWKTGYQAVRAPGMVEFGFGSVIPGVYEHTPLRGLRNVALLALRFHFWSWGWPLALVPALFVAGPGSRDRKRRVVARLSGLAVMVGLMSYLFYWSIGVNDTGPVKTYELLLPFSVVTLVGARLAARRWGDAPVGAFLGASFLVAAFLFWPSAIAHLRGVSQAVRNPLHTVAQTVSRPAVVFTSSVQPSVARSWVYGHPDPWPDLRDPVLYVTDQGKRNHALMSRFPRRHPYRLVVRGNVFRVIPLRQPKRKFP